MKGFNLGKFFLLFCILNSIILLSCSNDDHFKPPEPSKWEKLLEFIREEMQRYTIPGLSIAVIENGRITHSEGLGVKRYGGNDAVNAETLFRGGSTNKMLVCGAIMRLVEQGKIDLHRPITDYVPYFDLDPDDPASITPFMAMTHTSGLPDYIKIRCATDDDALSRWFRENTELPLWSPPGRLWNYSNLGYSLLGLTVEEVYGKPYKQAMKELIFQPTGMDAVTYDAQEAKTRDTATGHIFEENGKVSYYEPDSYDCALSWPPGYLFCSARDMAKFFELLLADGDGVLSPASVLEMMYGHIDTHLVPGWYYGYGLMSFDYKDVHIVEHDGAIYGYLASMWMAPQHKFGVAVIINCYHYDPSEISAQATDIFLDLPYQEPPDYSTPPSTWGKYTGRYLDPYVFGELEVFMDMKNHLWVKFINFQNYTTEMFQYAGDTFYFDILGAGYITVTFFLDDQGLAEYFATRAGVARRIYQDRLPSTSSYQLPPADYVLDAIKEMIKNQPRFKNRHFRPILN